MAAQGQPARVDVSYEKESDYRLYPANGVYGGLTPKGEIVVHFFVDHNRIPDATHLEQTPGADPGTYHEVLPQNTGLVRKLQCGVVLSALEARAIASWLSNKADQVFGPQGAQGND